MRILCKVEYNGTNYLGWQKQNDSPTIQGVLESKLSTIFNQPIDIYASGRTDAGVHAYGQCFHFDVIKDNLDLSKLKYSLNRMLPDDINILDISVVNDDFHARFSVKKKNYLYKIKLCQKNVFLYQTHCIHYGNFDYDLLIKNLKFFEGKHNFMNFTSKEEDEDNFIREIFSIDVIKESDSEIFVKFSGNGFMRYQIRFMVGAALAAASGITDENYIISHLDSTKERDVINYKAPSCGLYLEKVIY